MVAIIGNRVPLQQIRPVATESGLGNVFASLASARGDRARNDLIAQQTETEALKTLAAQREYEAGQSLANAIRAEGYDPRELIASGVLAGRDGGDLGDLVRALAANTMGVDDPRVSSAMLGAGDAFSSTPVGFGRDQMRQVEQNEADNAAAMARQLTVNDTNLERERLSQEAATARADMDVVEVMVPGPNGPVPRLVRRSEAVGEAPVLSLDQTRSVMFAQPQVQQDITDEQRANFALGGAPGGATRAPDNYVLPDGSVVLSLDGRTGINGEVIPPGARRVGIAAQDSAENIGLRPNVESGLQTSEVSRARFFDLSRQAREIAASDRTLFGPVGAARGAAQSAGQLLAGVTELFGGDVNAAIDGAYADMAQSGVSPGVLNDLFTFDPNLSDIQVLSTLLVYSGAAALAGQSGRDMSDRDVQIFKEIFGNPQGLFSSQQGFLARLNRAEAILSGQAQADADVRARGGAPSATPRAPGPAAERPNIGAMGLEQLQALDPSTLSDEELAAAARRFEMLSGGAQ